MKLQLVAFGIAKDILGKNKLEFELRDGQNVGDLRQALVQHYPDFGRLASLAFAVGTEYCQDDFELNDQTEVVLIPPVSGG